ncbi:hypothetical protein GE21DRAFT_1205251, partial [Neurospora crassa]
VTTDDRRPWTDGTEAKLHDVVPHLGQREHGSNKDCMTDTVGVQRRGKVCARQSDRRRLRAAGNCNCCSDEPLKRGRSGRGQGRKNSEWEWKLCGT